MKNCHLKNEKIHQPLKLNYSSNTTIHGMRYIGEKNRSVLEKLCWFIVLGISVCLCACLINEVYQKWQNTPVVVTFANNLLAVWEVPFPAVTICPSANTRKTFYDYTEAYIKFRDQRENMTEEELKRYEQSSLLCGDYWNQEGNKIIEDDTIDFLYKISHNSTDWWCRWDHLKSKGGSCKNLLTPVLTDRGVCYTFNMLDREEVFTKVVHHNGNLFHHGMKSTNWTLEEGYPKNLETDAYPRRTSAGMTLTLSMVLLTYEPDLDYICGGYLSGYELYLHNPGEMPRLTQQFFTVSFNKVAVVSITPEMMTTSDELKNYNFQKRKCYFSHERELKYFQVYTQRNCELECLTNYTLHMCGCVAFYMPRNGTTKICGGGNGHCIDNTEKMMNLGERKLGNNEHENEAKCNCLPACTSLTYSCKTSQVDYRRMEYQQAKKQYISTFSEYALTEVYFFFKDQYFTTSERRALYGLTDFIANCGGLLGVFTGFSFLSVVEILYFLSLRLVCNIRKHGAYFWSGSSRIRPHSDTLSPDQTLQNGRKLGWHQDLSLNNRISLEHRLTFLD